MLHFEFIKLQIRIDYHTNVTHGSVTRLLHHCATDILKFREIKFTISFSYLREEFQTTMKFHILRC